MTYPQPPYPPQGQPGYPPQGQPGYAPQQPYPPQQGYQPQQYAPPPPNGYPYPQPPYPPQYQPQQAPARATLGEFMDQPSMGGGSATSKFFTKQRPQNSWLQLQVTRDLLPSDVQHQENDGVLQYFKTGGQPDLTRPKFVLVIPTNAVGSSDPASSQAIFPDGAVAIWLKGGTRDALVAAIGAAGLPQPDKILASGKIGGAVITMISAGTRPARTAQYSDTNLFNFTYQPGGREMEAFSEQAQLQQIAQEASGFPAPQAAALPPTAAPAIPSSMTLAPAPASSPQLPPAPQQYAPQPGYPVEYALNGNGAMPAAAPAPITAPPAPPATAPGYTQPPAPPQGYQPYPGSPEIPQPQQYAPQAPPTAPPSAPPAGIPTAPGQPPVPPGYAPAGPPMTAELQATLARLHGQAQ
jgi:hypothetical protein